MIRKNTLPKSTHRQMSRFIPRLIGRKMHIIRLFDAINTTTEKDKRPFNTLVVNNKAHTKRDILLSRNHDKNMSQSVVCSALIYSVLTSKCRNVSRLLTLAKHYSTSN